MEDFLELLNTISETPTSGSGHTIIQQNLLDQPNDFNTEHNLLSNQADNTDLKVYVEDLKRRYPDKPILGGDKIITNVIKPNLPTPSYTDGIHKKVPWYLSKLCESTYDTRLCSRESSQNDPFFDNLAGQVTSKLNIPEDTSSQQKERLMRFNKEILKMYFNSEEYLEARNTGSSARSLATKAHEELKITLKEPRVLKRNIGPLFTPMISYVLTDSGQHSLSPSTWEDIASIPKRQARDSVALIVTNLYDIGKVQQALTRGLHLDPLSSSANYSERSMSEAINRMIFRPFSTENRIPGTLPGWEALNKRSKSVTYIYLGGGIVMVIIAGATFYLRTTDRQLREPQNLMDGIRGVGTALGKLLIASSKK